MLSLYFMWVASYRRRENNKNMDIALVIEKYYKLVYKICFDMLSSPQEAEDAVQDTYLNLHKSYDKYKNLPENEIKNILCRIALNRCKDILKSNSYKTNKVSDEDTIIYMENVLKDDEDIDSKLFEKEDKKYILNMVESLKYPYNEVLKMHYLDEMKLDDIEKKLDIPKPTLKVQIYRARKLLKEKLIKDRGGGYFE